MTVMRPVTGKCLTGLILAVFAAVPMQAGAQRSDAEKTRILLAARQSYYNLKQAGMVEFRANIKPNWEVVLGAESDAATVKLLNTLHFSISIDPESQFRMSNRADAPPSSEKMAAAFDDIYRQMYQAVSSFVTTWSVFMLTSPFPAPDVDCEVGQTEDQIRFSHKEQNNRVVTLTNKDFKVIEMTVVGKGFSASLNPVLEKTPAGYILKGYSGVYRTPSATQDTQLKVTIDYHEMTGLRLPHRVYVDTIYAGIPAQIEWLFTDYKVRVR